MLPFNTLSRPSISIRKRCCENWDKIVSWKLVFVFLKKDMSGLLALTLVCSTGNMMSRGQRGSTGQQQKATINGSLNKTGANITNPLSHSLIQQSEEGIPRSRERRANSLALEITFCNGSSLWKWKRTFNWPIKRKQSSQSSDMKQKANRICFISC